MISLKNVTVEYGETIVKTRALNQVSLEIQRGEVVTIMGKSGSGKTTLLKTIGGLLKPTAGEIMIHNEDIYLKSEKERCQFRRRCMGFIYQSYDLIPELTIHENVILPLLLDRKAMDMVYLKELYDKMELSGKQKRVPAELSGGEQQRVAIVRAMVNRPELLLCDEPTGNLDQQTGERIMDAIMELNQLFSTTIIVVTHDADIAKRANRIIYISDGKVS